MSEEEEEKMDERIEEVGEGCASVEEAAEEETLSQEVAPAAAPLPEPTSKKASKGKEVEETATTDRADRSFGKGRVSQWSLSSVLSAPISPTPPGPYLANGVRGGRFSQSRCLCVCVFLCVCAW